MADLVDRLSKLGLKGQVIASKDLDYDRARRVWNGVWDRRPIGIVRARSVSDVQKVVKLASDTGTLLAVRGGGHSIPGLSTCDGGIVLDLGQMNAITVDPANRLARVGGGALLGDLDRAGAPHGLVVPAGVISHTGAGGLTLGGGMGWLSRRFGMTVDHLVAAELVTASGEVIETSERSEPELFWGLRGGGGNFGVVTEFTFRMQDLGSFEARNWTYPSEKVGPALAEIARGAKTSPRSLTTSLAVTRSGLSITVAQSGPRIDPAAWDDFGNLCGPGQVGPRFDNFVKFQSRNDDFVAWGRRYYSRGGFLGSLSPEAIATILDIAARFPSADAEVYLLQLGGAVGDVPEGAMAYSGREAAWYWIVQPIWDLPAEDKACLAFGRAAAAQMNAVSLATNYVNEQGDASNDIARASYGDKYARLSNLKARFDPQNLFRLNQNILPAT